jgi:hypothetical protein
VHHCGQRRRDLPRLRAAVRKNSLLAAVTEVFAAFSESIQPFDADAAVWYVTIVAQRDWRSRNSACLMWSVDRLVTMRPGGE